MSLTMGERVHWPSHKHIDVYTKGFDKATDLCIGLRGAWFLKFRLLQQSSSSKRGLRSERLECNAAAGASRRRQYAVAIYRGVILLFCSTHAKIRRNGTGVHRSGCTCRNVALPGSQGLRRWSRPRLHGMRGINQSAGTRREVEDEADMAA